MAIQRSSLAALPNSLPATPHTTHHPPTLNLFSAHAASKPLEPWSNTCRKPCPDASLFPRLHPHIDSLTLEPDIAVLQTYYDVPDQILVTNHALLVLSQLEDAVLFNADIDEFFVPQVWGKFGECVDQGMACCVWLLGGRECSWHDWGNGPLISFCLFVQ